MMNCIKLIFAISAFFIPFTIGAQVKINPEIQEKVNAFIELSNQKKWDQAFDLMYPKLFTQVPKQDLVDLMTGMDQDGLVLQRNNVRLTSASVPFEEENESFVRLEYEADLIVQIRQGSIYDAPKSILAMTEQFQSSYGSEKVKWDENTKKYTILAHLSMMAIKSGNQWYLIEINNDQKELMEYLFSENVMRALVRL